MFSITYLCICIYCMLQLGFLLVANHRQQRNRAIQNRYFSRMLVIILFSFVADILSSFYHGPDWLYPFAAAGNYFEIILNTMLLPVYFYYVCAQISNIDIGLKRKISVVILILAVLCSVIVISTYFNGKVFYFDAVRNYHRGDLFWLPMTLLLIMMLIIEFFIMSQRVKIEASYYVSLLFFLIFPLVGWGLQFWIIGLPFSLISITFAAQVVFTNIQNWNMDTDYLTGAFNRQALDIRMQSKIEVATSNKTFSALLLDIDDFKLINDSFGHYEGDVALIRATQILRDSLGRKDFLARYGGDEFCVICEDDNQQHLEAIVKQIYQKLEESNASAKKPYQLSFSIGYAVYDPLSQVNNDQFMRVIDQKMYAAKKLHKENNGRLTIKSQVKNDCFLNELQ